MTVLADTSALYSLLDANDQNHQRAEVCLSQVQRDDATLLATNYIIVELTALLARRLGHQAVQDFFADFFPLLTVVWVDREVHERAVATLLTANQRRLSLWTAPASR